MRGLRTRGATVATLIVVALAVPVGADAADTVSKAEYQVAGPFEEYITMDDGVRLAANISFPSHDGVRPAPGRWPVVLSMTPYGKDLGDSFLIGDGPYFPARGFIRAVVDIRGAGASEGNLNDNYFSPRESRDSKRVIEWLGRQRWSNGRVGMYGGSYLGITQYFTAARTPRHLKAIAPVIAAGDLYREAAYHGGILSQFFGAQYLAAQQNGLGMVSGPNEGTNPDLAIQAKLSQAQSESIAFDYLASSTDNSFYRVRSPIEYAEQIRVPALIGGGWFDGFVRGSTEMFTALAQRRNVETRLWMLPFPHKGAKGPLNPAGYPWNWTHDLLGKGVVPFFDRYLKRKNMPAKDPVKLFMMGRDRYVESDTWPPRGVEYERMYMSPGRLKRAPVKQEEESYATNPADGWSNTLSSHGNLALTPYLPLDQSLEENEGLVWQTDPLAEPLPVVGPLSVRLLASSTAPDTDWFVRISDVAPSGKATLLCEGFLRASHRAVDPARSRPERPYHPHTNPTPIPRGEFLPYKIEIWPTANEFQAGHRLRVQLTSIDTPNHAPGTYSVNKDDLSQYEISLHEPAVNTVRYGGAAGTSLLIPVQK